MYGEQHQQPQFRFERPQEGAQVAFVGILFHQNCDAYNIKKKILEIITLLFFSIALCVTDAYLLASNREHLRTEAKCI